METLWFFLPMIIFLGIVTSYGDWKHGKIKNEWIKLALMYAILVMFGLVTFLFLTNNLIFSYVQDYIINIIISLLVGFFLWYLGIWSAGDGKLFFAYAALLPLSVYSNGYVPLFPSISLLINMFVPVSLVLIAKMLIKSTKELKLVAIKKVFNTEKLIMIVTSLFGISLLIRVFLSITGILLDGLTRMALTFIFYAVVGKLAGRRMKVVSIALVAVALVFGYNYVLSAEFLARFSIIFVVFIFLRYFVRELSSDFFSASLGIDNLRVGMFPAEIVYKHGKEYKKLGPSSPTIKTVKKNDIIFNSKRLSRNDIDKLRKLKSKGIKTLKVYQTTHFAWWMFLGVLLTIIFQGNILIVVKAFINSFAI